MHFAFSHLSFSTASGPLMLTSSMTERNFAQARFFKTTMIPYKYDKCLPHLQILPSHTSLEAPHYNSSRRYSALAFHPRGGPSPPTIQNDLPFPKS